MLTLFLFFFVPPMAVTVVAEYLCCRLPKRRWWRWLPATVTAALTVLVTVFRWLEWGEGNPPLESLLLLPGLPALGLLAGCYVGWRLWKWVWQPRVR